MHSKIHESLELLSYKLKNTLSPPAIKIIENEKYAANSNENRDWVIPKSYDNFGPKKHYSHCDVQEGKNCTSHFTRSSQTLYCLSKNPPENENILQEWNKNVEYALGHKDSKLSLDYPSRSKRENMKFLKSLHESFSEELVQSDSDTRMNFLSENTRGNEKSSKILHKRIENEPIVDDSDTSCNNPSNSKIVNLSFKNMYNCNANELVQYDSHTCLEQKNVCDVKSFKKSGKNELVQIDSDKNLNSNKAACNKMLFQRRLNKNEDEITHEKSDISRNCVSQNNLKRKNNMKNEHELVCRDSELSTELNETNAEEKMPFISALSNIPARIFKHWKNIALRKRMNLLFSQKIVENPNYLAEHQPSIKELEEGNFINVQSQLFTDSKKKVENELTTCGDKFSQNIQKIKILGSSANVQNDSILCQDKASQHISNIEGFTHDKYVNKEQEAYLENVLWKKKDLGTANLTSDRRKVQNIKTEALEIKVQANSMQMYPRDLNPFASDEESSDSEYNCRNQANEFTNIK